MRKIVSKIHLWISVPLGLVITITCFTGAMLVFEKEITAICTNNLSNVEAEGKAIPFEDIIAGVSQHLPAGVTVTGITVSPDPEEAYMVNISKPRKVALYVNQYTGDILGSNERLPFFKVMFRMHRWLMDAKPSEGLGIGRTVVGISTIGFVFILFSGIILWWPRNKKMLKRRLNIVSRLGWRRFLYDLHVTGGFYAALLLLAMSLTGLTWSFNWYRNGFYKMLGVEMVNNNGNENSKNKAITIEKSDSAFENKESKYALWEEVYFKVAAINPDFNSINVSDGSVSVQSGNYGNTRAADRYYFDSETGDITSVKLYSESAPQNKLRGWIYSVHVGSWGGLFTRILYFLVAILGASLPLTGYYLWIKRIRRR